MGAISGFTEGILMTLAFIGVISGAVAGFNSLYGTDESLTPYFTDNSGSEQLFINYIDTTENQVSGGEATLDAAEGITLKSSWGLIKDVTTIIWKFISGGWIEQTINAIGLGEAGFIIGKTLRVLYWLALGFTLLFAVFKVKI